MQISIINPRVWDIGTCILDVFSISYFIFKAKLVICCNCLEKQVKAPFWEGLYRVCFLFTGHDIFTTYFLSLYNSLFEIKGDY